MVDLSRAQPDRRRAVVAEDSDEPDDEDEEGDEDEGNDDEADIDDGELDSGLDADEADEAGDGDELGECFAVPGRGFPKRRGGKVKRRSR